MTELLLACFAGIHLTLMLFALLQKDLFKGILEFGGRFFQTKLLSRLSHKVCRHLSSPFLLHKFTIFERDNGTVMGDYYRISAKRTVGKERGK